MHRLQDTEKALLQAFTPTIMGDYVKVEYNLSAYVKHEAWNAFGKGNVVKLPIKIHTPPMEVKLNHQIKEPKGWKPVVYEPIHFDLSGKKPIKEESIQA